MSLITIKKSHLDLDIQFIKSKLESEGISCFIKNEFSSQVMSHLSSFEAELQVSSSDLKRALEILKEIEEN